MAGYCLQCLRAGVLVPGGLPPARTGDTGTLWYASTVGDSTFSNLWWRRPDAGPGRGRPLRTRNGDNSSILHTYLTSDIHIPRPIWENFGARSSVCNSRTHRALAVAQI